MKIMFALFFAVFQISLVNAESLEKAEIQSVFGGPGTIGGSAKAQSVLPKQLNTPKQIPAAKNTVEVGPDGDSYSLAPLVIGSGAPGFMTDAGQATSHTYDQTLKTIGANQYGTSGGSFVVIEKTNVLPNDQLQITVQVSAVNSQNEAEPWVDKSFGRSNLNGWRLDLGTNFGGNNPLDPSPFLEVVSSGLTLYDSAGDKVGDFGINDTSDSSRLSGIAELNLSGGLSIAGFDMATMVMHWTIEVDADIEVFPVSAGQSGAWYDPSHNGEGYFLQVLSASSAVVFWFSYDSNGDQFWMTGVGDIAGSKITFPELSSPRGGKFGPDFDPADVDYPIWGSLEFDFTSCDAARADYSGPAEFGSGTLMLTRLTALWGLDCEGNDLNTQSTGSGFLNGGFSGSWYDPSHDGEGFVVEVLDETSAVVIWFTYDSEGNPAWLLGSGQIDGADITVSEFQITSGGIFGSEFDPEAVVYSPWGTAAFRYDSCGGSSAAGIMNYSPPVNFGAQSSQLLNRLVSIDGLQCELQTLIPGRR
jgi:hypothetical protein